MIVTLAGLAGFVFGWFVGACMHAPYFDDNPTEDCNDTPIDPRPVCEDSYFVLTTGDRHDQK